MTRLTAIFVVIIGLLVIVAAGVWGTILLRPAPAVNNAPAAQPAFFDYPAEPAAHQQPVFAFLIGKPMTVIPNTMVCQNPADILAFWNTYDTAINVGNEDERRQAVTTALAASCQITQGVTFGVIVADEPPSPASPDEFWPRSAP
jgi:hypothetical protein